MGSNNSRNSFIPGQHQQQLTGIIPVAPYVFISDRFAAANPSYLQSHGISLVVSLEAHHSTDSYLSSPSSPIQHVSLPVVDNCTQPILPTAQYITNQYLIPRTQAGLSTLIHCNHGIDRSVAVAIFYLMTQYGMSYNNALQWIRQYQPYANPRSCFVEELNGLS